MKKRGLIIVLGAIVIVLAYWGYTAHTTRSTRAAIVAMLSDAAQKLRPALIAFADARQDFDADARALDVHVGRLRQTRTAPVVALADAADGYLISAREIVLRRAAMERSRDAHTLSLTQLKQHFASDRGTAGWTKQAVPLKAALDRDLRELRIATESYASLVAALPHAQAKVAPYVNTAWLADDQTIARARANALDALASTDENTRQATRIEQYYGRAQRR